LARRATLLLRNAPSCNPIQIPEQCGCSNVINGGDNVEDISEEEVTHATYPICYLCGSEDDAFSNPDLVLSLLPFLGFPEGTACVDLSNIGNEGKIKPEVCSIIQSRTGILDQCGCSNTLYI
jgi:hypothetical protein